MADNYERTKAEAELRERIAEAVKESTKNLESFADAQKTIAKNYKLMKSLADEINNNERKVEELKQKQVGASEEQVKLLEAEINALQKINEENRQQYALYQGINKELSKKRALVKSIGGSILDGAKALKDQFIPSLSEIFQKFLSIDHLAHQTANTLGFQGTKFQMMADNLSITRDQFIEMGFEAESAYQAQTAMADATGRQVMLTKEASKAMAETARITGMEVQELAGMTGEMEAFGLGAQQSTSLILEMSKEASNMGLNSGQVIKKFQQNLGLLNKLNFKAGVKGLKEMAKFSEKFKIDMQDVAAVADKVFRPEGAIEAAAQLQVLGGDLAALGDPFQLMYKARNAPEELAKSITKAATASATFNEKTGEFEVNAYELDRMREAAQALGMDYTKLVETAKQGAKVKKFEGLLGGKGLDKDTMDALTGAAQMGEKGAFVTIKGEPKLLKDLTKAEADLFVNQKKSQAELAEQAMSVQANFDAIKNKIMIALVKIFERIPWDSVISVMKGLGNAIVGFIGWFSQNPWVGLGTLLALYFGPKVLWPIAQGMLFGKAAAAEIQTAAKISSVGSQSTVGKSAALTDKLKQVKEMKSKDPTLTTKDALSKINASKMGEQSKQMDSVTNSTNKLGSASSVSAGQILALGAALLMVGAAIWLAAKGLSSLVESFKGLTGPQALGAVAGIALVMGGFVAIIYAMVPAIAALGTVGSVVAIPLLALGAAFFLIGAGIAVAALGLSVLVNSFTQMFSVIGPNGSSLLMAGIGFMSMAAGVGILTVSLIALGAASLLALPGLMILGGVTSMLTETATAIASSGGGEGLAKTINAINSVDTNKLEALKELSLFMSLLGASPTIKFDENLTIDGKIQISGQAGGKKDTDWVDDPIFVNKLKQLIVEATDVEKNGGKK